MPDITVHLSDRDHALLSVLVDEKRGFPTLEAVVAELLDHAQQGVYRPGAWERAWLMQAFGDEWLARLEPDPDTPFFARPRAGNT